MTNLKPAGALGPLRHWEFGFRHSFGDSGFGDSDFQIRRRFFL